MYRLAEQRRPGEIASRFRGRSDPGDRIRDQLGHLLGGQSGVRAAFIVGDDARRRQIVPDVIESDRELIPRRNHHMIDGLLQHADLRVRAYVADVIARDAQVRRELVEAYRDDQPFIAPASVSCDADSWDPDDIPF